VHGARALQSLLVAQLDAAKIEYGVLHRGQYLLAAASRVALVEGGDDAQCQVQTGPAIADLGSGDHRRAVVETGG